MAQLKNRNTHKMAPRGDTKNAPFWDLKRVAPSMSLTSHSNYFGPFSLQGILYTTYCISTVCSICMCVCVCVCGGVIFNIGVS